MSVQFSWDLPDVTDLFDTYIDSLQHATSRMDKSHASSPYTASATTIAKVLIAKYNDPRITRHTVRHQIDKRKKVLSNNGSVARKSKTPDSYSSSASASSSMAPESPKLEEVKPVIRHEIVTPARKTKSKLKGPKTVKVELPESVSPTLNKENPESAPLRTIENHVAAPSYQPPPPPPPMYPPNPYNMPNYYVPQTSAPAPYYYQTWTPMKTEASNPPIVPTEYSPAALAQLQNYVTGATYAAPMAPQPQPQVTPLPEQPQVPCHLEHSYAHMASIDCNDTSDLESYYRLFL